MKRTCHRSEELLLQGDADAMRGLERHAGRCADCARDLEDWKKLSAAAASLRSRWSSDALWPRIEKSLAGAMDGSEESDARYDVPPFDESADREYLLFEQGRRSARERGGIVRSFESRFGGIAKMAAAALLVLVVGGGSFFVWKRQLNYAPPEFEQWVLQEAALQEVEQAEQKHMASIDRLAELVEPTLGNADTPLMMSYREKLVLLDDAIRECRSQINENRQNAHLRRQLLAIYSEKDRTLRELMKENVDVQQ